MSNRKNKAIDVEIKAITDQISEVKINKNTLGQIDESGQQIQVQIGPNHKQIVKSFDEGVEVLIAEYNLHH
ncbi:DUF2969 domain-containing protein [Weissella coleopterorum]|uniref:DUF2969 domain-containing protein n=1 Tax=Weissella coleopterorum TaxID=2714949 RepID=A0A6G8AZJ0_9LACO|nr:DUF2969 domain-containing protein [Weissella coleopterorum]QIL50293.1 DUF2969 domain-containing protein [Weissella coleopterorum]